MANIDFSDVVNDPDLVDAFLVKRIQATVNLQGRMVEAPFYLPAQGIVTPGASADDLVQLPEGTRSADALSIISSYPLNIVTETNEADIVLWRQAEWTVHTVEDWSNWGQGNVRALLTRRKLA